MGEKIKDQVKTGDFCEIHLIKGPEEIRTYQSRVELIESNDLIFVYIPTFKTKLVKLPLEGKYEVLFKNEKVIFKYKMQITGYAKLDGELYMKIKLTSEGEKVQRRKYYRLDLNQSIYLSIPNSEIKDRIALSDIKDISAGGMRFVSTQVYHDIGDFITYFTLGTDFFALEAKIINEKDLTEFSDKYKVEYRAEFVNVSNYDRDKLVSHIFDVQRTKLNRTYGR